MLHENADTTIGDFVAQLAARFDEREAVVHFDALQGGARIAWSYARLLEEARAVAKALIAAGIGKGERVGLLMGNRNEFVAALFGAALAGALPVTLSTLSTAQEMRILFEQSEITLLLTQVRIARRSLADEVAELLPDLAGGRRLGPDIPFLTRVVVLGNDGDRRFESWDAFLRCGANLSDALLDARAACVSSNDTGIVMYTSGTTSQPKGVIHYHSTVTAHFAMQAEIYGRFPGIRVASPFPLFWSAGLASVLGSTLAAGGTFVAQEVFDPPAVFDLIRDERINEWYGFPVHTAALAAHPRWADADLRSMTRTRGYFEFDGHPNTSPDPNWNYIIAYGMSETFTLLTYHRSTTPLEIGLRDVGLPLPGMEVAIVNPDTGAMLGAGQAGEIVARGTMMMAHYLGMLREESFDAKGYFHTGDLGFIDPAGHLHWTGRLKDMIKTAGANVAPSEIEEAAGAIGAVSLCRALGVADQRLGEMIVLCVVPEEGGQLREEDVRHALRETLASYKVPRRVLFFAREDFPLTASGKVRDDVLRKLAAARCDDGRPSEGSQGS
jgi:fatty-acyl-CoA synthase